MILGTGGTSKTARAVVADMGAAEILTVSRKKAEGTITYEEAVTLHADAELIINTTPVGMYPSPEGTPIDISAFSRLLGVIDAVYNPLRTNLVLDAEARGIPAEGGLYMLVMQAVSAVEKFLDTEIDRREAERVYAAVRAGKESIVLTGMPGSGKSTVAAGLVLDGFTHIDTDAAITERYGATPAELISFRGEAAFRALEHEVIRDFCKEKGAVIATGGGAVLRSDNVRAMRQNGLLCLLTRPLDALPMDGRPLSKSPEALREMWRVREPFYRGAADYTIENDAAPDIVAARAEEVYHEAVDR
jgi:shikimate dehydrogenase